MHSSPTCLIVALAVAVGGCALFVPGLPPPHGLTGGEHLHVVDDSLLLDIIGPGLHPEDFHRRGFRFDRVLPAGAEVRVADDYVAQREALAPDAWLIGRNPWIYVEVVTSPIPAQRGWKGWIYLGTTGAATAPVAPLADATVTRESRLCPGADSIVPACVVLLRAVTPVRVLGCGGRRVHVELWNVDGLYIHGFVNATQLDRTPCVATKE
ncbi:MAG: hypothetical protein IPL61_05480 [Myxococcales bacterium]|nr:hypothetical protein [Myxococcales bacterium]